MNADNNLNLSSYEFIMKNSSKEQDNNKKM